MYFIRKANERGFAKLSWLESYHTFSFASYYDSNFMGFKSLRVINDDIIQEGMGFATHPHKDMEIITIMLEGAIEHKDSLGNITQIHAGEIQVMSTGSGVEHSEYNPNMLEKCRLYQIWIIPRHKGLTPCYSQLNYKNQIKENYLTLLASGSDQAGSLKINQDAKLYLGLVTSEEKLKYHLENGRGVWIQMIKGKILVNGNELLENDAIAVENESIEILGKDKSEFILFDLA